MQQRDVSDHARSCETARVLAIFAHQGGWDEMLMVAGPIVVFALILRAANRRAARGAEGAEQADATHSSGETSAPSEASRPPRSS